MRPLTERYPDLLDENADPALTRLVADLDAVCAPRPLPAHRAAAKVQSIERHIMMHRTKVITPAPSRVNALSIPRPVRAPRRLLWAAVAVAAAVPLLLLIALLGTRERAPSASVRPGAPRQGRTGVAPAHRPRVVSASRFITIDDPKGYGTSDAYGINAQGDIVGSYSGHEFLLRRGRYTTIDVPEGAQETDPHGINAQGDIVGGYYDGAGTHHGFLLRRGRYTATDDPKGGQGSTDVLGISDTGDIVGNDGYHGFLLRQGRYTSIDGPAGVQTTNPNGINAQGDIVGYNTDSSGIKHGFLLRQGRYTSIDDPEGVQSTYPNGINAQGDIVGYYTDSTGTSHGFVLRQGRYTSIDDPKAGSGATKGTAALGIDAQGDIIGNYTDSSGTHHGFLLRQG